MKSEVQRSFFDKEVVILHRHYHLIGLSECDARVGFILKKKKQVLFEVPQGIALEPLCQVIPGKWK